MFVLACCLLLAACGGEDKSAGGLIVTSTPKPAATAGPTLAPSEASCTPASSRIASIKRANQRQFSAPPERVIDTAKTYVVQMKTSKGDVTLQLDAANAPNTVNNFVFLACDGFYDGLTFHRVEPGFVVQGGDPQGNGSGGPGYRFDNEISANLNHDSAGVISMANSGPNTNGSQFFITLGPARHLNGGYNAFGRVTAGMEAVNGIRVGDRIVGVGVEER